MIGSENGIQQNRERKREEVYVKERSSGEVIRNFKKETFKDFLVSA